MREIIALDGRHFRLHPLDITAVQVQDKSGARWRTFAQYDTPADAHRLLAQLGNLKAETPAHNVSSTNFEQRITDLETELAHLEAENATLRTAYDWYTSPAAMNAPQTEINRLHKALAEAKIGHRMADAHVLYLVEDNANLRAQLAELPAIVEQLAACDYECVAGPLDGNVMFVRLTEMAADAGVVQPAPQGETTP